MPYQLIYHPDVPSRDLPTIDRRHRDQIRRAIENRLLIDPIRYGKPLRQSLKGYRKMRVGDFRVIYEVAGVNVRILAIGHRKEIYESPLRNWKS